MPKTKSESVGYDEESFSDKAKRGAGIFALIGAGALSVLHVLSHVVPAIGLLGLSFGGKYPTIYNFVSSEYVQWAFIPFVVLSFYYMYRDHKHHKHEKELRKKIQEMEALLKRRKI